MMSKKNPKTQRIVFDLQFLFRLFTCHSEVQAGSSFCLLGRRQLADPYLPRLYSSTSFQWADYSRHILITDCDMHALTLPMPVFHSAFQPILVIRVKLSSWQLLYAFIIATQNLEDGFIFSPEHLSLLVHGSFYDVFAAPGGLKNSRKVLFANIYIYLTHKHFYCLNVILWVETRRKDRKSVHFLISFQFGFVITSGAACYCLIWLERPSACYSPRSWFV